MGYGIEGVYAEGLNWWNRPEHSTGLGLHQELISVVGNGWYVVFIIYTIIFYQ